jgi:hypothetical protein
MKVKKTFEFDITEELIRKAFDGDAVANDAIDIILHDGAWKGRGRWPYSKECADKEIALNIVLMTMLEDIVNGMGKMKPIDYTETTE